MCLLQLQKNNLVGVSKWSRHRMSNEFLANLIAAFHTFVIIFVLLAPFSGRIYFIIMHILVCISLFAHWWTNSNRCSLSIIESKLRGLKYTESITHKFIAPVYDISKTEWDRTVWVITIILFCISVYNLANNGNWGVISECWKSGGGMECAIYLFTRH